MATTVWLRNSGDTTRDPSTSWGTEDAVIEGGAANWITLYAGVKTASTAGLTTHQVNTVTGPTSGRETSTGGAFHWITDPIDTDVTISGTMTFNMWGFENDMNANAAPRVIVERLDPFNNIVSTIVDSLTTEFGTSAAAKNWTASPTSTSMKKGDRFRIRIMIDDPAAATMATGFVTSWTLGDEGTGVLGDSWVQFTENFGYLTAAAGTVIYPTNTASDVATAAVDREAWTSRGAGVQNDVVNTTTGYVAPIQWTDTAGGTVVDWWTKMLASVTLGGRVDVNLRHAASSTTTNAASVVEIAICESDGTSCVNWGSGRYIETAASTTEAAVSILVSGPDTLVTAGQRLRIRFLIDDATDGPRTVAAPMTTGATCTLWYAGTSGGASGDTFLTFSQTLTEGSAAAEQPAARSRMQQLLSH